MRETPAIGLLPDGRRLHLREGPIDLIVEAFGSAPQVKAAHEAAIRRFDGLLEELTDELAILRAPIRAGGVMPAGTIARRMVRAVTPFAVDGFITPMAAVAGSVAEEILAAMIRKADLTRAYVNDGGDIALYLSQGQSFAIGLVDRPDRPSLFGKAVISYEEPSRGIATSGRHGRSFSLGIADAVTVIAATASAADAAATMIANHVDLPGHQAVVRAPASSLQPDSDLRDILVTRQVGPLAPDEIETALSRGEAYAKSLIARGLIHAAALHLAGTTRLATSPLAATDAARQKVSAHA